MEQILCLATKRTDETVLVCGLSVGHGGYHWDDVDNVTWRDDEPQTQQQTQQQEKEQQVA